MSQHKDFYKVLELMIMFYVPFVFTISNDFDNTNLAQQKIPQRKPQAFLHQHVAYLPDTSDLKHHMFFYTRSYKEHKMYKSFCAGNIITPTRVLSASVCFYRNSKRLKRNLKRLYAVSGVVKTYISKNGTDHQQWRKIERIYTQLYFRWPSYNLAVVKVDEPWEFNKFVGSIPFASLDQDFDGICKTTIVMAYKAFSVKKTVFTVNVKMILEHRCESIMLKTVKLFLCTAFDPDYETYAVEPQGSGLICYGTGDPEETNENEGILVGITSLSQYGLPTFHHRIGRFYKWVKDGATRIHLPAFYSLIFVMSTVLF